MSVRRTRREPVDQLPQRPPSYDAPPMPEPTPQPTPPAAQPEFYPTPPAQQVPHTRTGTAWMALAGAALLAVLLIIFLVQNTRSTEISFLWMTTSTPVAFALLIAAVGSVLLTLVLGTARIAQLRRLVRKQRN